PLMSRRYVFSSESVGEGHPDKVCDTISDAVLDACIKQDPRSRVACATYAKSNIAVVGGEITIPNLAEDTPLSAVLPINRTVRELTRSRKSGKVGWLRPDAKSQVSVIYENGRPIGISCVVVSTQHSRDVKHSEIRSFIVEEVIRKVLPNEMLSDQTQFLVNPT